MKDPAFLFYPNDYLGGTMGMTFEQKGAYVELLMTQFNRGHMTSHMVGQVLGQNHGQLWDILKDKFEIDEEGKYFNRRLDEEKKKRKSFTDSRRNNLSGTNQHSKPEGHMGGHVTSHMENDNENRNININKIKKELAFFNFDELYEELMNSGMWIDGVAKRHETTVEVVKRYIKKYCEDQDVKDEGGRPLKDYKRHFVNWIGAEMRKRGPGGKIDRLTYNQLTDLVVKQQAQFSDYEKIDGMWQLKNR